jgi:hypothetical protein
VLQDLIDQERQHHQQGKDRGEVLVAEAVVVAEVVALIFEGVEGLVSDAPTDAPPRMIR